ncbi:ATP-binding protein [Edaphosphingomonas haloaromaticamans]|uniref:histidine kinase n=1 Tax=Edaphosphingomonas haloaromaticamans TaxID=653954 RepID=A0A1S1HE31_9SPHN|nr:ATP-binding protein [Sphingomonas haloaromaticamans]OHT20474.1 Sensor protein RstB [Sphingomonas haloaromaticamans]
MRLPRPRGLPIFWQTLLLVLASLAASQIVTLAMFVVLDPPRPDFNRLGDVADALAGGRRERGDRERVLIVQDRRPMPVQAPGMTSDPAFTRRLADRLGRPEAQVRLFFEPDQRASFGNDRHRHGDRLVPMRRGEPLFFGTVTAAVERADGWRVVNTPPRPLIAAWQRRILLWFALSAIALLPLAWWFARRLTRPIRRFADAAERMGHDPLAPRVAEEGPAELRQTAHALNLMQERIAAYVAERTAMIGAIAHDLRTPLARIAFRIEAAPDDVRDKVQADIEQMRAMIAATIGFVRGSTSSNEIADVELGSLLEGLAHDEADMGRPVSVGRIDPVQVRGDRLALARLFQNLIDNGVTYGERVELSLVREGQEAVAIVADRGAGIDESQIDRLFQPFERGDPSRNRQTGGIGLGLTIARSIAREHGGTLILRNRAGGGLEAVCRLPVRNAGA